MSIEKLAPITKILLVGVLGLLSAGCIAFSPDGGLSEASNASIDQFGTAAHLNKTEDDVVKSKERVRQLIKKPLTINAAIEIALINNRSLQAEYNRLGAAEAIMQRNSLPPNPVFSFAYLSGPFSNELDGAIVGNILALATLPARKEVAAEQFKVAQLHAAAETLRLGYDVRRDYYKAIATLELATGIKQESRAFDSVAGLAHQLAESGAMNRLEQAQSQLSSAEVATRLASANLEAIKARESLTKVLGLWGADIDYVLPKILPQPPSKPRTIPDIEAQALNRRIELRLDSAEMTVLSKTLGVTVAWRFIDLLELAGLRRGQNENFPASTAGSMPDSARFRTLGGGIAIEIPLYDFGETKVRAAEQRWMEAVNTLAHKAILVRSQVRQSYQEYRYAHEIFHFRQTEVNALQSVISEETLRRYNGMLIDPFPLLENAKKRILLEAEQIIAKRDYWIAETDLRAAISGPSELIPTAKEHEASTTMPLSGLNSNFGGEVQ